MTLVSLIRSEKWEEVLNRTASHPDEVLSFDNIGYLPIHWACGRKNVPVKVIEALIEVYPRSVEQKTKTLHQELPIHVSVRHEYSSINPDVVEVLLRHYKEGAAVGNLHGLTPLGSYLPYAFCCGLEITKMLVEANPDAVRIPDICLWYPLHYAAKCGNWQILKYLIDLYPEALLKKSQHDETPRDLSKSYGHEQLCDKILQEEENHFGNKER